MLRFPLITPRLRSIGVLAMLVLTWGGGDAAAQDRSLEYAVKATYLYKFVPFVAWPSNTFASPASRFDICIIGDPDLAILVTNAVAGQSVSTHAIAVRRVTTLAEESTCQILFVGGGDAEVTTAALVAVRG
ncbi:MAG TPA: YfiR family protein, partial [Stellaceae bacterium]|nr:YfiR family protein [Stellaceae bacterium]